MRMNTKNIKKDLMTIAKIALIGFVLSIGFSYLHAWNGPPIGVIPPANNTPTPLNIGPTDQTKNGGLELGSLATYYNTWLSVGTNDVVVVGDPSLSAQSYPGIPIPGQEQQGEYQESQQNNTAFQYPNIGKNILTFFSKKLIKTPTVLAQGPGGGEEAGGGEAPPGGGEAPLQEFYAKLNVFGITKINSLQHLNSSLELIPICSSDTNLGEIVLCPVVHNSISISPKEIIILKETQYQFGAFVNGIHSNSNIGWSSNGGLISNNGLFTAPDLAGTYQIRVTSLVYPYLSDTAVVDVPEYMSGTQSYSRVTTNHSQATSGTLGSSEPFTFTNPNHFETTFIIEAWGGGGAASYCFNNYNSNAGSGGAGGYTRRTTSLEPLENQLLDVSVGCGGGFVIYGQCVSRGSSFDGRNSSDGAITWVSQLSGVGSGGSGDIVVAYGGGAGINLVGGAGGSYLYGNGHAGETGGIGYGGLGGRGYEWNGSSFVFLEYTSNIANGGHACSSTAGQKGKPGKVKISWSIIPTPPLWTTPPTYP